MLLIHIFQCLWFIINSLILQLFWYFRFLIEINTFLKSSELLIRMTSRVNDLRQLLNDSQTPDGRDPDYNQGEAQSKSLNTIISKFIQRNRLWAESSTSVPDQTLAASQWGRSRSCWLVRKWKIFHCQRSKSLRQTSFAEFLQTPKDEQLRAAVEYVRIQKGTMTNSVSIE